MSQSARSKANLVGFGSQGRAWANCLRQSGWEVDVYLSRRGRSFEEAQNSGFSTHLLDQLPIQLSSPGPHWVAFLCPDSEIGSLYHTFLSNVPSELNLILAHGYAVYADELRPTRKQHCLFLLAPKAIGPRLQSEFHKFYPAPHALKAGICGNFNSSQIEFFAKALGFSPQNLIHCSFESEAIGDLISEQGLLCGGVFNLFLWTAEAMAKAGVPEALIREECITELELIASLIREKGPAQTFRSISQAAQCGTTAFGERLQHSQFKTEFEAQVQEVISKHFVQRFRSQEWKSQAQKLSDELQTWQDRLGFTEGKNR